MKKTDKLKEQNKKLKDKKSNKIVNAVVLILLSLLLSFAWLNEIKEVNLNDLIEIKGKLVSYDYRTPGDRGTGYESRVLFVKLDNYKSEFRLHIDYDLFKIQTKEHNEIEIKSYIEPKYRKHLDKNYSDIPTIGLYINGINYSDTKGELIKRNKAMKYGTLLIIIVLFIWGVWEILRVIGMNNEVKLALMKKNT